MAKLQQIKRSNGSLIHSVNLPGEVIDALGWEKGDELDLVVDKFLGSDAILISKRGGETDGQS